MKISIKKIIIFIILIAIHKYSHSQILIGVTGGYCENNFHEQGYHFTIKYKIKDSYNISTFYIKQRTRFFWFGFAANYNSKFFDLSTSYNAMGGDVYTDLSCKLSYLYLSLNPEFRFGEKYSFFFSVNPFYGLKVLSQGTGTTSTYTIYRTYTSSKIDNAGDLFQNESGLLLKSGFDILLMYDIGFVVETGYSISLLPLFINTTGSVKSRDRFIRLGLSYLF